jgi:hypothetical protein
VASTLKPSSNPLATTGLINSPGQPITTNPLATPGLINSPPPPAPSITPDVIKSNPLMATPQPPKTNPLAG